MNSVQSNQLLEVLSVRERQLHMMRMRTRYPHHGSLNVPFVVNESWTVGRQPCAVKIQYVLNLLTLVSLFPQMHSQALDDLLLLAFFFYVKHQSDSDNKDHYWSCASQHPHVSSLSL